MGRAQNITLENKGYRTEKVQLDPGLGVGEWSLRPILPFLEGTEGRQWRSQGGGCWLESSRTEDRSEVAGRWRGWVVRERSVDADYQQAQVGLCGERRGWREKMENGAAETAQELKKRIHAVLSSWEEVEVCLLWQIVPTHCAGQRYWIISTVYMRNG